MKTFFLTLFAVLFLVLGMKFGVGVFIEMAQRSKEPGFYASPAGHAVTAKVWSMAILLATAGLIRWPIPKEDRDLLRVACLLGVVVLLAFRFAL